jgi:hypothetical protein
MDSITLHGKAWLKDVSSIRVSVSGLDAYHACYAIPYILCMLCHTIHPMHAVLTVLAVPSQ